jgi:hypothetical protein
MKPSANPNVSAAQLQSMHDYWGLFLAEGIALSVLGLAAIIVPPIAGLFTTVFLGWLFLIAGIVGLVAPDLGPAAVSRLVDGHLLPLFLTPAEVGACLIQTLWFSRNGSG